MQDVYAKIDMNTPGSGVGTVVNTLSLDPAVDTMDSAFTWVDLTSVSPQPSIGWTYNGSTFTNPNAPVLTLLQTQMATIHKYSTDLSAFVNARYDLQAQFSFLALSYLADKEARPNQVAAIKPLLDWANAVLTANATFIGTVMAQTTIAAVNALTWDFSALGTSDPGLSLVTVALINN